MGARQHVTPRIVEAGNANCSAMVDEATMRIPRHPRMTSALYICDVFFFGSNPFIWPREIAGFCGVDQKGMRCGSSNSPRPEFFETTPFWG